MEKQIISTNDELFRPFLGLYATFCELDLFEMQRIQECIESNRKHWDMDSKTIFAQLEGRSLFAYFDGNLMLLNTILEYLEEQEFEDVEDLDEKEIENPVLRRIIHLI